MIIDKHPEQVKEDRYRGNYKFIGFWKYVDERYNNKARVDGKSDREYWEVNDELLPTPYDYIDLNWNKREKQIVLKWFYSSTVGCSNRYFCGSVCRICGEWLDSFAYIGEEFLDKYSIGIAKKANKFPSFEGKTKGTDPTFVFPASFVHYIEKHNVKPPQVIIDIALLEVKKK